MITVEIPLFFAHEGGPLPRFGNHHHHGVGQGMACHVQIFQTVVEHGRVTARGIDDREYLFHIGEEFRFRLAFAGVEPVDIALDRIDFAVVDDIAVRMGPGPAGEGIGAEPRVDEGHRRRDVQVGQVEVEMAELDRRQHALVYDCPRRQAGDVEIGTLFLADGDDGLFGQLADDIQLAFKVHLVGHRRALLDEDLQEMGTSRLGDIANQAFVDGNVAPSQNRQAFGPDDV